MKAEGDAFNRVGVLSENAADLSGVVVAEAHHSVQVAGYDHRLGRMQFKNMNLSLVEVLIMFVLPDDLQALLLDRRPHTYRLVGTGTHNLLAAVEVRELGAQYLALMPAEGGEEVAGGTIHQPQHVVFATTEYGVSLWVPLHEIDVIGIGWSVGHLALLGQSVALRHRTVVFLHLPHPKNIIESTGNAQFAIEVELDEFHGFGVAFKLHDLQALVLGFICGCSLGLL